LKYAYRQRYGEEHSWKRKQHYENLVKDRRKQTWLIYKGVVIEETRTINKYEPDYVRFLEEW
jgi:hypothetical protein